MSTFGLIGRTLGHSLSAPIHEQYFARIGAKDDQFSLIELAPDHIPFLRQIMNARDLTGVNVTIPYKYKVMELLDELTPEAQAVGAVNTIARRGDRLIGHNTDIYGFSALLRVNQIEARGAVCALLGASGGAAQAAIAALKFAGAKQLLLISRAPSHEPAPDGCTWLTYAQLAQAHYDLLINCTPVGTYPAVDASPVAPELAARATALVDMVYNPPETRFLSYGHAAGVQAVNGLYMLVGQAIAAQAFWRDIPIDEEAEQAIYQQMRGDQP